MDQFELMGKLSTMAGYFKSCLDTERKNPTLSAVVTIDQRDIEALMAAHDFIHDMLEQQKGGKA